MEKTIDDLLRQCTVRLNSDGRQGTGFFVAPRLLLTCAHVVEGAGKVVNVFWASQNQHFTAQIETLISDLNIDLALLRLDDNKLDHPCVYFDQSIPILNDPLYIYGYPLDSAEDYSNGDSVTIKYEGKSFKGSALLLKLKEGQIKDGFSGSPLLNLRTGGVCGIVNISRSTNIDLGGRAVPTAQIFEHILGHTEGNRRFHQQDLRWRSLIHKHLQPSPLKSKDAKSRGRLLSAVKINVDRWLAASLPTENIRIELLKEMQPKLVCRPSDDKFRTLSKPSYLLAKNTNIIDVFQQEVVSGRLLILGEPGSGKTVSLLELANHLVRSAENDLAQPIPVVFNLSTWKNQKLEDWLVTELNSSGYGVSNRFALELIKSHQLIPLLDGLDDLNPTEQSKCITAINKFLAGNLQSKYLVVCSRLTDYKRCFPALELNNAVCLTPLQKSQIEEYLKSIHQIHLWNAIKDDSVLVELAKTPLFLFLLVVVFEKSSRSELRVLLSAQNRYRYLFNSYIDQMLENANKSSGFFSRKPSPEKTKKWLAFIAINLKLDSKKEFLIEGLQPKCLQTKQQKTLYRVLAGLTAGLLGGLALFPFGLPLFSPFLTIISFLVSPIFFISPFFLITGLAAGIKGEIKPVETLTFSSRTILNNLRIKHVVFWLVYFMLGYFLSLLLGSVVPIIGSLVIGLFVSSLQGNLANSLRGPDIDPVRRSLPNQGIKRSAFNSWILGLIFGLMGSLVGGIAFFEKCDSLSMEKMPIFLIGQTALLIENISQQLKICPTTLLAITFFSSLGMMSGSLLPGTACFQHFALRVILWWNGYTPWNYAHFLNYATDKGLLKRIGGRYRFIHDLLQDHFAQL
jgi:hypothetical protein